jgi:Rod binding domain-containing protein
LVNLPVVPSISSALKPEATQATVAAKSFAPKMSRDVSKEFEAFVLQSFIQEMLPKTADNVYGGGIAGDIWRSMLSEQLAFEVAERGGIGIADQVRGAEALKNLPQPGMPAAPAATVASPSEADAQKGPTSEPSVSVLGSGWRTVVERS